MKIKILKHAVYYASIPVLFCLTLWIISFVLDTAKARDNLGAIIAATYLFLLVVTPCFTAVIMRFSMLPWIVDPFAAIELPLSLAMMLVLTSFKRSGSLSQAFAELSIALSDDNGIGYLMLAAWFLLGLICSISPKRRNGDHLPGRLIRKISNIGNGKSKQKNDMG